MHDGNPIPTAFGITIVEMEAKPHRQTKTNEFNFKGRVPRAVTVNYLYAGASPGLQKL